MNKQLDQAEEKIVAALAKKSELYDAMNSLKYAGGQRGAGDEQASIAENLSIMRLKRVPLRDQKDHLTDVTRYVYFSPSRGRARAKVKAKL